MSTTDYCQSWYILGCAPVAALLLNLWARLFNPWFGVDAFRHLMTAAEARRLNKFPTKSSPEFLFAGIYDYPPTVAYLASLFPRWFDKYFQMLFSPMVEALNLAFLGATLFLLGYNPILIIKTQFLVMVIPAAVIDYSQYSSRGAGYFLFNLLVYGLILFAATGAAVWLLTGAVAFLLIVYTHKMAHQVAILFLPLWALTTQSFWPILLLAVGETVAFLINPTRYRWILKGHLQVLDYFRRNISFRYEPQFLGKSGIVSKDMMYYLKLIIRKAPIITILSANLLVVMPVILLFADVQQGGPSVLLVPAWKSWALLLLGIALVTAYFRPLLWLGDGYKYVVYLSVPAAVLTVQYIETISRVRPGVVYGLVLAVLLIQSLYLQYSIVVKDRGRSLSRELAEVFGFLKPDSGKIRLATFPLHLSEITAYFTGVRTLSTDSASVYVSGGDFEKFFPSIRRPFSYFADKYQISHLLLQKKVFDFDDTGLDPRHWEKVFDSEGYEIFSTVQSPRRTQTELRADAP